MGLFTRIVSAILLTTISTALLSQAPDSNYYRHLFSMEVEAHVFSTDRLHQLYIADGQNHIRKYDPNGQELFDYSNRSLGLPSTLDAFDPFETLVFYPDFGLLVVLDRTMNELYRLDLQAAGYFGVEAIARASDNHFWVFSPLTFQLLKLDAKGKKLSESRPLQEILPAAPIRILEKDQFVYLQVPDAGIYIFDTFGQWIETVALPAVERFQVLGNELFYLLGGKLHVINLQRQEAQELPLPTFLKTTIEDFSIQGNRLFLVSEKTISIFEI